MFSLVDLQVYLHTAPLCHIGGISSCMAILMAGGCHVLKPKFDAKSAFDAIKEHGVTSFITVPAIMADLLSYARFVKVLKFSESLGMHNLLVGLSQPERRGYQALC